MSNNLKDDMDALFSNLEKFIQTKTVIGEPIKVGETTLIPIISVMFGCGMGNGSGTDNKGMNGTGGGGGVGARISPNGVVVIKNGEVSMLPVNNKSNLEALVAMVPEIVSKINLKKNNEEKDDKDDKENDEE